MFRYENVLKVQPLFQRFCEVKTIPPTKFSFAPRRSQQNLNKPGGYTRDFTVDFKKVSIFCSFCIIPTVDKNTKGR